MTFQKSLLLVLFLFSFSAASMAQGIEFFQGSWKEALELSKETGQLIFVDANTAWCGPCRRMAKEVFTQEKVGAFYNERFINMKIDMEKGDIDFRTKYSVRAYPTLLFIDQTGAIVKKKVGGQRADGLLKVAKEALSIYDNVDEMQGMFEQGKRDAAFLRKYVKALKNADKPSEKATNEYIRNQKDLSTKENLLFIFDAVASADSKVFDLLIKHKKEIVALKTKEAVHKKIQSACNQTVMTAIEFQDIKLLGEAKSIMKTNHPSAKTFAYQADIRFYAATKDEARYLKCVKKYAKKIIKKDASKMNKLATDSFMAFPKSDEVGAFAEKLAAKSVKNGGIWEYYFAYAQILSKRNSKEKALEMATKAMELAKEKKVNTRSINLLLRRLKQH